MDIHNKRVKEFMQKANQETPSMPGVPDEETRLLRARLILEECLETIEALGVALVDYPDGLDLKVVGVGDMVEVMDGIADICVVANGTAIAYGVDMERIQYLVDQSNLDKFRGDAHEDPETGKWIKPSDWEPPNIAEEIGAQMNEAMFNMNLPQANSGGCCGGKSQEGGCCNG
jgi:predicted HAD superfamily Cof-like phosphohydrolase